MSKRTKILIIIIIVVITAILGITILSLNNNKNEKIKKDVYIMKSVNNTVALYKNEDLIKVYDRIVVDTLPVNDRLLLEKGIEFSSESEATLAAEDYDG